jgi:hypothetical protein
VKENAVILFTRIPVPGKTKTRLQPFLTPDECCRLQSALIRDIYQVLQGIETACDILVCHTSCGDPVELRALLPAAGVFFPQRGDGMGERMHNAIYQTLEKGYRRCLLIGSDLPLLQASAVDEAFCLLESRDVVVCPTEDGGYYLIGMKDPCEAVFRLEYGDAAVFEKTLAAAAHCGKTYAVGACTMDIDKPEDLLRLKEKLVQEDLPACPETRIFLAEFFRR